AKMGHTVFGLMPWRDRARYLELLIRSGLTPERRIAVFEVIRGTRSEAELEAVFAIVRRAGAYEPLFADLDDHMFKLLTLLGEFRSRSTIDSRYVVDLVVELFGGLDADRELHRA